jgi:hypothetical protein
LSKQTFPKGWEVAEIADGRWRARKWFDDHYKELYAPTDKGLAEVVAEIQQEADQRAGGQVEADAALAKELRAQADDLDPKKPTRPQSPAPEPVAVEPEPAPTVTVPEKPEPEPPKKTRRTRTRTARKTTTARTGRK